MSKSLWKFLLCPAILGFYKYQLTDNISVTPGVKWLTAPGQDENNALRCDWYVENDF